MVQDFPSKLLKLTLGDSRCMGFSVVVEKDVLLSMRALFGKGFGYAV
jgi:hypothetical protein